MPLLTELPAGSANKRYRHGAAHSANLFSVRRLAVGADDTFAAGEVLLSLDFGLHLTHIVGDLEILLLLFPLLAFSLKDTRICLLTKVVRVPREKFTIKRAVNFIYIIFYKFIA